MQLKTLLKKVDGTVVNPHTLTPSTLSQKVTSITLDSRRVHQHSVFVASKGATSSSRDGHAFIKQAQERNALCILVEDKDKIPFSPLVPFILVKNARAQAAKLIEELNGNPSRHLDICAITGTNGKTTVSFLTAHIMKSMGKKSAVIGTLGFGEIERLKYFGMTTPEAEDLSSCLKDFMQEKYQHVTMEVSSHALALHRVDGILFKAAAFTNLSVDHLDFHGDLKQYKEAKNRLFKTLLPSTSPAILPENHELVDFLKNKNHLVITWGYFPTADIYASQIKETKNGIRFCLNLQGQQKIIQSNLFGAYNIDNMLCAAGLSFVSGADIQSIANGLSNAHAPPGRMQRVTLNKETALPLVFIDFAHTPDALKKVLNTLKAITHGKLIVVFGCGGNRDKSKRPEMGLIASKIADVVYITSDNPRHEEPLAIMNEILKGVYSTHQRKCHLIENRKEAIYQAIQSAHPHDVILIAGKGHESTQQIGDHYFPFQDNSIAESALENFKS